MRRRAGNPSRSGAVSCTPEFGSHPRGETGFSSVNRPVRIHLGHHFYGAGNVGDDFMLAGFLGALASLAPDTTLTCCVPFPLAPLQQRFPAITWLPCDSPTRARCIADSDAWLGLGGSPFQHALSRWFLDHLLEESEHCRRAGKPMFYLGIGVQTAAEVASADVRVLVEQAAAIWTRDPGSAERLAAQASPSRIHAAADLAHLFFRAQPPPPAQPGRACVVANFDYATWPAQPAFLRAIETLSPSERVWLAQETRELPGAERALYATLPPSVQVRWKLVTPDVPGEPLGSVLGRWPSGEWLLTSRYHAALAGGWAGSKVIVIETNEKLRAAAAELGAAAVRPDADEPTIARALASATPARSGAAQAGQAFAACEQFVRAVRGARSALAGGS